MELLTEERSSASAVAPPLEQGRPTRHRGRSPLVWWHLLSLDAPTIAVLWCWFFAAAFGIAFRWVVLPTLALGTWCVYVADRLLDGLRTADRTTLRERHWFYLRHRRFFTTAWIVAAAPLAYLLLMRVPGAVRTDDIALALIGATYFLLIHGPQPRRARWFPKELAVGLLFAIATAIPAWARIPADRGTLAAAIVAFGAACWLNCVAIQIWEDAESSREFRTGGLTRWLGQHLLAFAGVVGAAGLALTFLAARTPAWPLFAAVTLSALLFFILIRQSHRFSVLALRIAADAALLTPLLFLARVR
ncbi:MAG: hypothetical protein ACYDC6_10165 [Acidobacteriaceae bacterium]